MGRMLAAQLLIKGFNMIQNSSRTLANTKFGKRLAIIGWVVAIPALLIVYLCNTDDNQKSNYQNELPIYIENNRVIKSFDACISRSKLDEMTHLAVIKDYVGLEYLNKAGYCFSIAKGARVSVLDRYKFRLYKNDGSHIDLYTAPEFLRAKKQ